MCRVSTGPCGRENSPKSHLATCQSVGLHIAAAEMAQSILFLLCLLNAAHGALFPAATPAARLDQTQYVGAATIWSPITLGSTLACMLSTPNGQLECSTLIYYVDEPSTRFGASTVTTNNAYWAWCSLDAADCTMSTECNAGTVSWAGGEMAWYDLFQTAKRTAC